MVPETHQFVFPGFKRPIINHIFQIIILGQEFIAPVQLFLNQVDIQDQSLILTQIWFPLVHIASFLNSLAEHAKYIRSQLHLSQ